MIALHIGIELTMNMHVFEILSIVGWCMFFIVPDLSYTKYIGDDGTNAGVPTTNTNIGSNIFSRFFGYIVQHIWVLNLLLFSAVIILIMDTFPLYELHDILQDVVMVPLAAIQSAATSPLTVSLLQVGSSTTILLQTALLQLYDLRRDVFYTQFMAPYFYHLGIYQEVWNLYSGAPDTNCIYTTSITTYTTLRRNNSTMDNDSNYSTRNSYTYASPDWGEMTWYEKKRYQRPMTMQEKLVPYMCRDCYVQYHANNLMQQAAVNLHQQNDTESKTMTATNIHLASATLTMQCENPPYPPVLDDWFNWTGWFYANAKQDVLVQHDPVFLYTINICEDLNVDLCQQWYNEGLCYHAHNNHNYRHSFNNGTLRLDHDAFVYNITQTCRRSCRLCPEQGYDSNHLTNGTRLSIYWPLPSWDDSTQLYTYDPTAMYYDGTIIQVRERPMKQYLIRYDIPTYNNEWFDPIILRDRGYHFIPALPEGAARVNPEHTAPLESVSEDDADVLSNEEDERSGEDDDEDDDEVEGNADVTTESSDTRDEL
jgi:hypothetical protein